MEYDFVFHYDVFDVQIIKQQLTFRLFEVLHFFVHFFFCLYKTFN